MSVIDMKCVMIIDENLPLGHEKGLARISHARLGGCLI